MQKKFLSNLLLIVFLNLLVKPYAIFGVDAVVQNRVGTADYGLYFSLLNLSFLFNILADVGINNFTTKNVAQFPHIASKYIGKTLSLRLILFVIYASATLLLGTIIGYRGDALLLLSVLVFNQLLVTLIAYFRSHFGGLLLFKTDAFISVLDRLLLIFICGTVFYFLGKGTPFQLQWFVWMQTAAYSATLLVAYVLLVRKIGMPRFQFHWTFSLAILRKSYPYALLILLMMAYTRTDSIMLALLHPNGKYEAGIYAQGFRLLDAFFMFGMIFANLLLPIFSKLLMKNNASVLAMLTTSRNLLVGGALFVAFICVENANFFLHLIYDHGVEESVPPFRWLMWSFVGMCISLIYGTLLTVNGNLRLLNQLSFVGVLLNIGANTLLIPHFGATGAAFATLITQFSTALAQIYICNKQFHFTIPFIEYARFGAYILVLFIVPKLITSDVLRLPIHLLCGIVGMVAFKLIDVKQLKKSFY